MPKIDSMIDTMANTVSLGTKFAGALSVADTFAKSIPAFAKPMNTYDTEVNHRPAI